MIKTKLDIFVAKINRIYTSLFKTKKAFYIGLVLIFVAVLSAVSFFVAPKIFAQNIVKPTIKLYPETTTNKDIIFEADTAFVVELNNSLYYSSKNSPFTLNLGKQSGLNRYDIFGYLDLGVSKILSTNKETFTILGDYEAPKVKTDLPKEFYTTKEVNLVFEIDEPEFVLYSNQEEVYNPQKDDNKCQQVTDSTNKISCKQQFLESDQLVLNYSVADKLGNTNTIYENQNIKYVLPPELACNNLSSVTNKSNLIVSCNLNKSGLLKVSNGQEHKIEKAQKIDLDLAINEGQNNFDLEFVDEHNLNATAQISAIKDTQKPVLNFTTLDTKKKFLEGNYTVGFVSNEDVSVSVSIQPYNDFIEKTPGVKGRDSFGYSGGSTFTREIAAKSEQKFSTKNNMGTCQIVGRDKSPDIVEVTKDVYDRISSSYSELEKWQKANPGKILSYTPPRKSTSTYFKYKNGYCNFYNGKFIRTIINATDKAGNKSTYYCTGLIYDDKVQIKGDGKTRCSQNINEIGCEWFYNEFVV